MRVSLWFSVIFFLSEVLDFFRPVESVLCLECGRSFVSLGRHKRWCKGRAETLADSPGHSRDSNRTPPPPMLPTSPPLTTLPTLAPPLWRRPSTMRLWGEVQGSTRSCGPPAIVSGAQAVTDERRGGRATLQPPPSPGRQRAAAAYIPFFGFLLARGAMSTHCRLD